MSMPSNVRLRTVADPTSLRALAHPLRLELHGLVARAGTLTAAEAARQLGISHALASHHLRQLAKYGYVEPAEASDERARPWRVTATSMTFEPVEPEARLATDVIQNHTLEQAARQLAGWQGHRAEEDPRWSELAGAFGALLYLEPEELADVLAAWRAVITPYVDARPVGYPERRPGTARPVSFTLVAVPVPRTEQGG